MMINTQKPIVSAEDLSVSLPDSISGLVVGVGSTSTLTISPGYCRDSTGTFYIDVPSSITLSSGVIGANGLDTGPLTAAATYAVYVIGDSRGYNVTKTLISLSATAPYLPAGYDIFRRIGWAVTFGSAFDTMIQTGSGFVRTYWRDSAATVLNAGTSTTLAVVSLANVVPPINTKVYFNALFTPAVAGDSAYITSGSSFATAALEMTGVVAAKVQAAQLVTLATVTSGASKVQYKVTASGSLTLYVNAFEDYL